MRRASVVLLGLALFLFAVARPLVRATDRILNSTFPAPHRPVSEPATTLHGGLWIADLHTDALLWDRSLLSRSGRGHVDVPRLLEGGIRFEVFSVTTRYYIASNYHRTPPVFDVVPLLAIAARWPRATWWDARERALYQAAKLRASATASGGRLRLIETRTDFDQLLDSQARGDSVVGALLLLEGMHAIDGRLDSIDALFAAGFRVFGIAHMFDNDLGGSSSGWNKTALSPLGRRALARIDSLGAVIDLAHASTAVIDDVLATTSRPVLISHTGVTAICPGPRNVSDDVLTRVAARGGLVGIGFWDRAVCGRDAAAVARAIHHAVRVAGIEHVALGSDFDGAVRTPFDAAGLALLTDALLAEGLSRDDIARVMGENAKRFFREMLPQ